MYFWISFKFTLPTAKYHLAHRYCYQYLFLNNQNSCINFWLAFNFNILHCCWYEILGGIYSNKWMWSVLILPLNVSMQFAAHISLTISLVLSVICPVKTLYLYFMQNIIWYLRLYILCEPFLYYMSYSSSLLVALWY